MMTIKQKLVLEKEDYYKVHLSIINQILPLQFKRMTPKEIEFIADFLCLEGEEIEEYRFNPRAKKKVMARMQITPAGMSNYIDNLVEKQFLIRDENNKIKIIPLLIPEKEVQMYMVRLENQSKEKIEFGTIPANSS